MSNREIKTSKLVAAIRAADRDAVNAALAEGADIEEPDMHGFHGLPLRTACFTGNLAIIRDLIKKGANINAAGSDGPSAPLRLAHRRGYHDVFGLLLQHGAEIPADIRAPLASEDISVPALDFSESQSLPPPPAPALDPHAGNLIEFTPSFSQFQSENTPESEPEFGDKTRLLSMDLLFMDENETLKPDFPPIIDKSD